MKEIGFFYKERYYFRGRWFDLFVNRHWPDLLKINDHVFHWKCWPADVPQENEPCVVMAYFDGFGDALVYGRMAGGIWVSMSPVFPFDGSHDRHPANRKKFWYSVRQIEESFKEDF